jgi:Ca-activated chloride channel homolog
MLEEWKEYRLAIALHERIIQQFGKSAASLRHLALAYYQQGNFQKAVDTYYDIITSEAPVDPQNNMKAIALNEMNAIIALQKGKVNIQRILPQLVKELPVDLYITVENFGNTSSGRISEPGNAFNDSYYTTSSIGGFYQHEWSIGDYGTGMLTYSLKAARKGSYTIEVPVYNSYAHNSNVLSFTRVIVIKNFQKPDQQLEIRNVILNNLYGRIKVASVRW